MHERSMTKEAGESHTQGISVALLIENEVLAKGLEALLCDLDRVSSIRLWDRETLVESLASQECDILIIAAEQWSLLDGAQNDFSRRMPRILVLGNDPFHEADGLSSLPSDGFLTMSGLTRPSLDDALQRVTKGEIPIPAQLARHLLSGSAPAAARGARPVRLTSREHETLALLAHGLSNKQVARSLGISTHGAKRLVGAILLKLGSPNRTAAVVTAMKTGLV